MKPAGPGDVSCAVSDSDHRFFEAQRLHVAGRLEAAEALYRDILSSHPADPDASHYLGVLMHQRGAHADAGALIEQALVKRPNDAGALVNLANVCRAQGKAVEAIVYARLAATIRTDLVEPHLVVSGALADIGEYSTALGHARRALELRPGNAAAMLAVSVAVSGLSATPAPARSRDLARADYGTASELVRRSRRHDALAYYRSAIDHDPSQVQFHIDLGTLLHEWDDLEAALACFRCALVLDPQSAQARCNLAITLHEFGRHDEALVEFETAAGFRPEDYRVHWNKALTLLSLGRWREGFEEYEWRWRLPNKKPFPAPAWNGEPFDGKTILLHAEQGLGDALQFIRYAPMVKARGGRVLLLCGSRLHSLLEGFPGIDLVIPDGPMPAFDLQAPLLGLPRLFATTPEAVPPPIAFNIPSSGGAAQASIRQAEGLKVGLVWAGNPDHPNDARRSCPVTVLAPLLDVAACSFFSLQKGAAETALTQSGLDRRVRPLSAELLSLGDTAAAIEALDLVITVDTSVAHLAGTLGKPVWILLPFTADWRWLTGRSDTPWYPSARLFRQQRRGDWASVVEAVRAALAARPAETDASLQCVTDRT